VISLNLVLAGLMGQDIEKVTLAKGLQYHLEDRVLTCNNKTVVFS
jgi:formyltetrahydrofolate deformylase